MTMRATDCRDRDTDMGGPDARAPRHRCSAPGMPMPGAAPAAAAAGTALHEGFRAAARRGREARRWRSRPRWRRSPRAKRRAPCSRASRRPRPRWSSTSRRTRSRAASRPRRRAQMKANHTRTLQDAEPDLQRRRYRGRAEAERPGSERGARHHARRRDPRSAGAAERHAEHADRERARPMSEARPRRRLDRKLGRHVRAAPDPPLPAARTRRPPDRLVAVAAAVLVVGRPCGDRGRAPLSQSLASRAVLRRRLRDARRGLHLERHPRPRSRRQGRAHALAPDPVGPGERDRRGRVPRRAGAGRACRCCCSSTASRSCSGSRRSASWRSIR